MSSTVPDPGDGSRVEAEVAGVRHEEIDASPHAAHHPPDPNAGVVRATPPSRGALLVAATVAVVTVLAVLLLAAKVT